MITLVYGGSASGKSEYAEGLLANFRGPKYYLATMEPFGEEGARRVARRRALRAGKGFETLEKYTGLAELKLPGSGCLLLECLGNLAANELFSPSGAKEKIARGLRSLAAQCSELVIVSNDVFSDGRVYDPETERYLALLAQANAEAAALAGRVIEVVCGIPIAVKGELP